MNTKTIPTVGRIVLYTLSAQAAEEINASKSTPGFSANGLSHAGNWHREGDRLAAVVVRCWPTCVNLQVFVDGNYTHWAKSVPQGLLPGCAIQPGTWDWAPSPADQRASEDAIVPYRALGGVTGVRNDAPHELAKIGGAAAAGITDSMRKQGHDPFTAGVVVAPTAEACAALIEKIEALPTRTQLRPHPMIEPTVPIPTEPAPMQPTPPPPPADVLVARLYTVYRESFGKPGDTRLPTWGELLVAEGTAEHVTAWMNVAAAAISNLR